MNGIIDFRVEKYFIEAHEDNERFPVITPSEYNLVYGPNV